MATTVTDTASIMLESVSPTVQKLFDQSATLVNMIKPGQEVKKVSRYFFRQPLEKTAGGVYSKTSIDGASLGSGTGPVMTALRGAYQSTSLGFRITMEQEEISDPSQATVNLLSRILGSAMKEIAVMDDIGFNQDGSGVLTNAGSATNGTTTITFNGATDYLHVNNLRPGMAVEVWDTALTTKRSPAVAAPLLIDSVNTETFVVTFNQTVTGITSTDKICINGLANYGAATPLTGQSTFPVSTTGGVGGDSFRHGWPYMVDSTGISYFYGIQKSTLPQIVAVRVNANSSPFEIDHFMRYVAKTQNKRDDESWGNNIGICNMAQRAQIAHLGYDITTVMQTGDKFGSVKDMVPENLKEEDLVFLAGKPVVVSKRAPRDRIAFVDPKKIVRAEAHPLKYMDNGSGGYFFVVRNASGEPCTAKEFFIIQSFDYVCLDAGTFGQIDSLTVPDGWDA